MIKRAKELWEEHVLSRFTVTSLPLIAVGILGCLAPLYLEPKILGAKLDSRQWIFFRLLYNGCIIGLAYWRPHIPDTIEEKLFGTSVILWKRSIAWGLSLSIYRLPFYSSFAMLFGYEPLKVVHICVYYFAENLVLGLPYLWISDWCRRESLKKQRAQQSKAVCD